jgi:hypothetical protein
MSSLPQRDESLLILAMNDTMLSNGGFDSRFLVRRLYASDELGVGRVFDVDAPFLELLGHDNITDKERRLE